MLNYKDHTLTASVTLTDANAVIELQSDIDCGFVGVFTLSNNSAKSIQFLKYGDGLYKGKISFTSEDLKYLKEQHKLYLVLIEDSSTQSSNEVFISLDLAKIKASATSRYSLELIEMRASLAAISKTLDDILKKRVIDGINILGYDYVKPGMIPVAINTKGTCVFQYPFQDIITSINGITTVDKKVTLTAKDIPSGKIDVETRLNLITSSIQSLGNHVTELGNMVKKLTDKVGQLELQIATHTDTSIV